MGHCDWVMKHIHTYINAVAGSVMLYLHDFYNVTLKMKHKLHIAPGTAPPPSSKEKSWVRA
jgi:hypothetical protein